MRTMLTFVRRNLALLTLLMVTIAVGATAYTALGNQNAQLVTCRQVEALKEVVRQVIRQGDDALGRSGSAGFAYYQAHPKELAAARAAGNAELNEFGARHC